MRAQREGIAAETLVLRPRFRPLELSQSSRGGASKRLEMQNSLRNTAAGMRILSASKRLEMQNSLRNAARMRILSASEAWKCRIHYGTAERELCQKRLECRIQFRVQAKRLEIHYGYAAGMRILSASKGALKCRKLWNRSGNANFECQQGA